MPTTFAVQSVLLSFSSSNAIGRYHLLLSFQTALNIIWHSVLAKYLLVAGGHEITDWNTRGLAVGVFTGIVASELTCSCNSLTHQHRLSLHH
jgi:hypothetical protein